MSEEWNTFMRFKGETPVSIALDTGIARECPLPGYPILGTLALQLNAPGLHGLTDNQEYERVGEIDDRVTAILDVDDLAINVGRSTSNGIRTLYFYTRDADTWAKAVKAAMKQFPNYNFDVKQVEDSNWDQYWQDLSPSQWEWQSIGNQGVLRSLHEHGDDPSVARMIDHMALFASKAALYTYSEFLKSQKFDITRIRREKLMRGKHMIEFERVDIPNDIDTIVKPLFDKALELSGEYDGWASIVVKREDG
ncbi:MAG: DUF695 domain-containing protein [Acidimicrobiales bacterium]|nr:DUF695 domain-containing protein [Hyphomonadaceae bacterium]RZV40313.1 MAG: DUF695 domain-containing protein [Acidimicrobiales bacterium]